LLDILLSKNSLAVFFIAPKNGKWYQQLLKIRKKKKKRRRKNIKKMLLKLEDSKNLLKHMTMMKKKKIPSQKQQRTHLIPFLHLHLLYTISRLCLSMLQINMKFVISYLRTSILMASQFGMLNISKLKEKVKNFS